MLFASSASFASGDTHFIQQPSMTEWAPPVEREVELPDAIVKRVHHQVQGGRHVCIEECEPPIEEVKTKFSEQAVSTAQEELTDEQQALIDQYIAPTQIQISATVYYEGDKPFSHLRLRCGEDKVEAWSSMNFAEMALGISHYKARGIEYYSFVGHSIERNRSAIDAGCPTHRDKLNRDKARFLVVGERHEDCTALEALRGIHVLYNQEKDTLKAAYQMRLENHRKAEEWRKPNPQKPKDITIRFWKRDLSNQEK